MIEADILFFSDPHFPFQHEDSIFFLEAVKLKYRPRIAVCGGDLTDSYCFSRYPKDPEQISYSEEFQGVQEGVILLAAVFPELTIVDSNHDARLWNRATLNGIPRRLVRSYLDVIGAPVGWILLDDLVVQDSTGAWWYVNHQPHGSTVNYTKAQGMNTAVGHNHASFGASLVATPRDSLWAVDIGCLIGHDRIAFGYSKNSVRRPARGCVVVIEGVPRLVPMRLGPVTGRWDGKVH